MNDDYSCVVPDFGTTSAKSSSKKGNIFMLKEHVSKTEEISNFNTDVYSHLIVFVICIYWRVVGVYMTFTTIYV